MVRLTGLFLLGLLLVAAPVAAQHANQFEASFAGGYHTYGSATELRGTPGLGARLGYWFYGPFSLEGEFNYARPRTNASDGDRVTVSTFAGWLLGNFPVGAAGSVLLKGGYGTTSYGSCPDVATPGDGPCGSVGVLQGGAGARIAILPAVQLRIDGVINTGLSSRKFSNALVQGGVSILLGGSPRSSEPPPNTDPDGDGVSERADRCPGTLKGARVDAVGCSHDADGDHSPDGIDACPDTPAGAQVDARGCPSDGDGDGVFDGLDRCPESAARAEVDRTGCPRVEEPAPAPAIPAPAPPAAAPLPSGQPAVRPDTTRAAAVTPPVRRPDTTRAAPVTPPARRPDTTRAAPVTRPDTTKAAPVTKARVVILPGTIWNYRSSTINRTGYPGLDSIVALLKENPKLLAEVQGYAHDRLVPVDNTLLSKRRADAIKSYIVSKGVTAGRVSAAGLGSRTLLVSDTTDAARITNRRVEVHIRPAP
jgi:outer membrane protein OmpA-like peptidoglycan-associated protein